MKTVLIESPVPGPVALVWEHTAFAAMNDALVQRVAALGPHAVGHQIQKWG